MVDFNCPQCGSQNTKTLSAIWSSGSRSSDTNAGGVSFNSKGVIRVSAGKAKTRHTSVKVQNAAPPSPPSSASPLLMAILAFFISPFLIALMGFAKSNDKVVTLIGALSVTVPFIVAFYVYKHFKKKRLEKNDLYALALNEYERLWMCQRCNAVYEVSDM